MTDYTNDKLALMYLNEIMDNFLPHVSLDYVQAFYFNTQFGYYNFNPFMHLFFSFFNIKKFFLVAKFTDGNSMNYQISYGKLQELKQKVEIVNWYLHKRNNYFKNDK
jgi:hypothetical protein